MSNYPCSAGRCVGLDCEMVGTGPDGSYSMLARVCVVNHHGHTLYDTFVSPMDKVTDYRSDISGVSPKDLRGGEIVGGGGGGGATRCYV